jgi:WD40 repeat protein/tRNA A-37 threonylcarbamoyl transferase component Bud32
MGSFLETPAPDRLLRPSHLARGTRVGKFEVVRVLGAGGSATVYEAMQQSPRRRVALKTMHAQLSTEAATRRFRDEAEILARLQHPDIAHVYEAGVFEAEGRRMPWFALELVESGRSLLAYCEEEALDRRRRLELFTRICRAIHHGHQKGIIHRDIKPENLLVDGSGRPKVIDFGIARIAGLGGASEARAREVAGTLPYMSPEQCRLLEGEVDVRSDVYALGVLLYELLTGRLPHDVSDTPIPEATRRILEDDPTPIAKLDRSLRGDLALIVHKAMARQRSDRYQSAADLGRDVERYLAFRPVSARSPTSGYHLRLLARRRTALVCALAGLLVVLVGGAVVSTVFAWRAERSRRAAVAAGNRERSQSYIANVSAADAALRVYDVAEARRRLLQADRTRRRWEWRYLTGRLDGSLRTLRSPRADPIRYLSISPDGSRLVAASHAPAKPCSFLTIWGVEGGEVLAEHGPAETWIRSPVWSPDGRRLAWCESGGILVLADPAEPDRARRWNSPGGDLSRLEFDPSGGRLATASLSGEIRLWSVPEGEILEELAREEGTPNDLAFAPDGSSLATCACDEPTIHLRELLSGGRHLRLKGHRKGVLALGFSPDGRRLVSGSLDGTLRVWDTATGEELIVLTRDREPVLAVSFDAGGDRILSGHLDGTLTVWDPVNGVAIETTWGHTAAVESVVWGSEAGEVHSASRDGTVKSWRLGSSPCVTALGAHERLVRDLAYNRDGALLACACFDHTVRVYDPGTGAEAAVLKGHRDGVQSLAFFPDGRRLVSGGLDSTVRVWDLETSECRLVCRGHGTGVCSVAVGPDGTRLASGATDRTAIVWDSATGERLLTLPHKSWVWTVAFSPRERLLLTSSADGWLRLWSLDSGAEVRGIRSGSPAVECAVFSRDGTKVIAGGADGRLGFWEVSTGRELASNAAFSVAISDLALSPDGSRLLAAAGRSVGLWDTEALELVLSLRGHRALVYAAAFHPDGTQIATGGGGWVGEDCSIRLWGRVPEQPWPPDARQLRIR